MREWSTPSLCIELLDHGCLQYSSYTGNPLKSEKNKYFFMGVLWVTSRTRSSVNIFNLNIEITLCISMGEYAVSYTLQQI